MIALPARDDYVIIADIRADLDDHCQQLIP